MTFVDQLGMSDVVVNLASAIFIRHGNRLTFEQSFQLARDISLYSEDEHVGDEIPDSSATFWDSIE